MESSCWFQIAQRLNLSSSGQFAVNFARDFLPLLNSFGELDFTCFFCHWNYSAAVEEGMNDVGRSLSAINAGSSWFMLKYWETTSTNALDDVACFCSKLMGATLIHIWPRGGGLGAVRQVRQTLEGSFLALSKPTFAIWRLQTVVQSIFGKNSTISTRLYMHQYLFLSRFVYSQYYFQAFAVFLHHLLKIQHKFAE